MITVAVWTWIPKQHVHSLFLVLELVAMIVGLVRIDVGPVIFGCEEIREITTLDESLVL